VKTPCESLSEFIVHISTAVILIHSHVLCHGPELRWMTGAAVEHITSFVVFWGTIIPDLGTCWRHIRL